MFVQSGFSPWVSFWLLLTEAADCRRAALREGLRKAAGRKDSLRDQAVCVLAGGSADAELRDWAERYLCGMTEVAPERFRERRRAQG